MDRERTYKYSKANALRKGRGENTLPLLSTGGVRVFFFFFFNLYLLLSEKSRACGLCESRWGVSVYSELNGKAGRS